MLQLRAQTRLSIKICIHHTSMYDPLGFYSPRVFRVSLETLALEESAISPLTLNLAMRWKNDGRPDLPSVAALPSVSRSNRKTEKRNINGTTQ
jgi:hypothetical protein